VLEELWLDEILRVLMILRRILRMDYWIEMVIKGESIKLITKGLLIPNQWDCLTLFLYVVMIVIMTVIMIVIMINVVIIVYYVHNFM
jgi:hypothetical protein